MDVRNRHLNPQPRPVLKDLVVGAMVEFWQQRPRNAVDFLYRHRWWVQVLYLWQGHWGLLFQGLDACLRSCKPGQHRNIAGVMLVSGVSLAVEKAKRNKENILDLRFKICGQATIVARGSRVHAMRARGSEPVTTRFPSPTGVARQVSFRPGPACLAIWLASWHCRGGNKSQRGTLRRRCCI